MAEEKPAVAWKIAWSYNGYRGWDHRAYREWLGGSYSGFGYVDEYGFGHEWWNFYEGFSDEYYYGYAPPIHAWRPKRLRSGGAVFFISHHPRLQGWFLVGVYGGVEVLDKPPDVGLLWDYVPEEYRGEIRDVTKNNLESRPAFLLRAEKELSTPMPRPMGISLREDLGVSRLGQASYKYLGLEAALALLDKAIGHVENLVEEIQLNEYWIEPGEALHRLERLREALASGPALPPPGRSTAATLYERRELPRGERVSGIPERLIEEVLSSNLEVVEKGLRLEGRQVVVPGIGRIDILARDQEGRPVVIEVKSGVADDSALTQVMAYMSGLESDKLPRGIIIAEAFTRKLRQAVQLLENVKLVKIAVKISL